MLLLYEGSGNQPFMHMLPGCLFFDNHYKTKQRRNAFRAVLFVSALYAFAAVTCPWTGRIGLVHAAIGVYSRTQQQKQVAWGKQLTSINICVDRHTALPLRSTC